MATLSVLIPARNEEYLSKTVEDLLANIEGDTEIIVGLDGRWAEPPLKDNPKVTIVHVSESIGQRAMTNQLCQLSRARFVMKVDAHCAFDKGFDVKMMEAFKETGDEVTMAPVMRNLHIFNWVCPDGHTRYQGPSGPCKEIIDGKPCGKPTTKDVVWIPKTNPQSVAYCFDPEPHFQYDNGRKNTEEFKRGIITGYKLSVEPSFFSSNSLKEIVPSSLSGSQPSSVASVVSLLTNFADSHHFTSSTNSFGGGKDVSVNTMGFPSINNGGGIRTDEVLGIGDELKMQGVTASPILTEVVNNGNVLSSTSRNFPNEPGINQAVCVYTFPEIGTVTITSPVGFTHPIPTTGDVIDSNLIKELNNVLGGEFVYNEKTESFHNGSVALIPIYNKDLTESMSLQGSCFMLTRDRYWSLNICDEEAFGSWGSQGIEVACKTWLTGGRVIINHRTWYAHCFRTQGGDFGFPYELSGKAVSHAKAKAKEMFFDSNFHNQVYPLSWLVEKFWPVPKWTEEDLKKIGGTVPVKEVPQKVSGLTKGILYYTDHHINMKLGKTVRRYIAASGLPITSVTLKPMDFGHNIHFKGERGYLTMFKQILTGLEVMTEDIVYLTEHDCLYPPEHFKFTPSEKETWYYEGNYWMLRQSDGFAIHYNVSPLSGLVVYRESAIKHFRERVALIEKEGFTRQIGFEPFTHRRIDWKYKCKFELFMSSVPTIDIAHAGNSTWKRWKIDQFRNKPKFWQEVFDYQVTGWPNLKEIVL